MVPPSPGSTAVFLLIVVGIAVAFVVAVGHAGRTLGQSPMARRRAMVGAAVGAAALMGVTAGASWSGVLEATIDARPPAVVFFMGGSMLVMVATGLSPVGARLARGTPIVALVAFQGFRLPLELVLHRWADEGVLPIQMTYSGHNFDIVTGIAAVVVAAWLWRKGPSPQLVAAFNLLGLVLLVTVASIAIRSTPGPFRTYDADPPVLLAFHFPYGWIVPICVGGALLGHIVVFRWLWAQRRGVGVAA